MSGKDTLLRELDQLAAIPRWKRAGKVCLVIAVAAAAAATRATQSSLAVAIALAALLAAGVCFGRARQLSVRLASPEKSQLGVYAAKFEAAMNQPPPPKPNPAADDSVGPFLAEPVAFTAVLREPASFPTDDGGSLDLPAGPHPVRLRLALAPERPEGSEVDYPVLHLEIDADGATWRARSYLDPDCLALPVIDPERARAAGLRFWRDVPDAWRAALRTHALIARVCGLLDSRVRFQLPVGDEEVTMMLKHQGPQFALAWLPAEERLVVRISDMYYETWTDGKFEDIVDRVELGYLLDPIELLPLGKSRWHYREWGDWWEEVEPRPPVFERVR